MNNSFRYVILILLSLAAAPPAPALELFGVALEATNRDELRDAASQAGLILVREGGEDTWFDVYDSSAVLAGSTRFYLGFVKQDQRFAFAEYEFKGLSRKRILRDLNLKYGAARVEAGRFESDRSYHWQRDGIEIELSTDWENYRTRLSYINPVNLSALLAEKSAYRPEPQAKTETVSLY